MGVDVLCRSVGTLILGGCMGLAGCFPPRAPAPYRAEFIYLDEDLEKADCGAPPSDVEASIRAHMQTVFKDPETARYRFAKPPIKTFSGTRCMYLAEAFVNAKNSYGGYTGEHRMLFYIRDGAVLGYVDATEREAEYRGRR